MKIVIHLPLRWTEKTPRTLMTAFLLAIGALLVFPISAQAVTCESKPFAIGNASSLNPSTATTVLFSHSGSYVGYSEPECANVSVNDHIVEFQWILETIVTDLNQRFSVVDWWGIPLNSYSANGLYFRTSDPNAVVEHDFNTEGTYYSLLRVVSSHTPSKTNIAVIGAFNVTESNIDANGIPEPTSLALLCVGVAGLIVFHRRNTRDLQSCRKVVLDRHGLLKEVGGQVLQSSIDI